MATLQLFKSRIPSCSVIFPNGKAAIFVGGRYATKFENEVAIFEEEIALGHPHIYRDPDELTVDSERQDPHSIQIDKVRKDLMQEMLQASLEGKDLGEYLQGQLNPANSETVAAAVANGGGLSAAQKLALLHSGSKQVVVPVTGEAGSTVIPNVDTTKS